MNWLKLTLSRGDRQQDAIVQADPAATLATVLDAAAAGLGLGPAGVLGASRSGESIDISLPISLSGLRSGDIVSLDAAPAVVPAGGEAEVVVTSGPLTGRAIMLSRGLTAVGTGPGCDLDLDDASLPPGPCLMVRVTGSRVECVLPEPLPDGTAQTGVPVYVNGVRLAAPRRLAGPDVVELGRTSFGVRAGPTAAAGERNLVSRPPRRRSVWIDPDLELAAPAARAGGRALPLASALLPLIGAPVLWLLTKQVAVLAFGLLSPMIAVGSYVEDRFSGSRNHRRSTVQWRRQLDETAAALRAARAAEFESAHAAAPSVYSMVSWPGGDRARCWERRPEDDDFLRVRLGTAPARSAAGVRLGPGGDDALSTEARQVFAAGETTAAMPATADLAVSVSGITGDRQGVLGLARALLMQVALAHSPLDVRLCAAVAADAEPALRFLSWLPHVDPETGGPSPWLGAGPAASLRVIEAVAAEVRRRRDTSGESRHPHLLVVVDESLRLDSAALREVLGAGADLAMHVLWLGDDPDHLPSRSGTSVVVATGGIRASVPLAADGEAYPEVDLELLDVGPAISTARQLAPLHDAAAEQGEGALPSRIDLLDLLGIDPDNLTGLERRWRQRQPELTATLGSRGAVPFEVELGDVGNHVLIGGTTGAGKSELLQALVCSLAVSYPPDRVVFLLIDYKGGAAFRECVDLPHTVGLVTDLDRHLTERALVSMRAEVRRRLALLDQLNVRDWAELEHRHPDQAPPRLVIVVDEFATLLIEIPAFVDGIVDLAARGRSLGIRLVLATQRPKGIVSEKMRANIGLRISLRVNDADDSRDIIGVADAVAIPRSAPGRAVARGGPGDLTTFQSGYVGGTAHRGGTGIAVAPLRLGGTPIATGHDPATSEPLTDLQRVVRGASSLARTRRLTKQRSPWLPALPEVVSLRRLRGTPVGAGADAVLVLGVFDEPDRQRQAIATLNLDVDGHLMVFGGGGSGKTTLLRSLTISSATRCDPADLHVYGLDFATRGLLALGDLPHVGAVVPGDDVERVHRVLARITGIVADRKERWARVGATTLSEYRSITGHREPRVLFMLDGYPAFAAAFDRVDGGAVVAGLPRLVADARPLGVHVLITADRPTGVPGLSALMALISRTFVLRLANESDYAGAGLPASAGATRLPPGRGWYGGLETQVALAGDDPSGQGQRTALAEAVADLGTRRGAGLPAPVLRLPAVVPASTLPSPSGPFRAVLGLEFDAIEPIELDLRDANLLVAGPPRSGRSGVVRVLARSLAVSGASELLVLTPLRAGLEDLGAVATIVRGAGIGAALAAVEERVERRIRDEEPETPLVLLIDDGEQIADPTAVAVLERVVRRGADVGVRVVGAVETQSAHHAFGGWIRELRKERFGLLLDANIEVDGELLGTRLPRGSTQVRVPGRGFMVTRGLVQIVQVGLAGA